MNLLKFFSREANHNCLRVAVQFLVKVGLFDTKQKIQKA